MTRSTFFQRTACALVFAGAAMAGSAVMAAPASFSFRSIEFLPADQRAPAAEAFVQQHVPQGVSVRAAVEALRGAGAYCPAPRDGVISCYHASLERHVGHDLTDVTWKVDITAAPDGTVATAAVHRITNGV